MEYLEGREDKESRIMGNVTIVNDPQNEWVGIDVDGIAGEANVRAGVGVILSLKFRVSIGAIGSADLRIDDDPSGQFVVLDGEGNQMDLFLQDGVITVNTDYGVTNVLENGATGMLGTLTVNDTIAIYRALKFADLEGLVPILPAAIRQGLGEGRGL